jgi:hypothetical protein
MKEFEDYELNEPYPTRQGSVDELLKEFDNTPMTKAEREELEKSAYDKSTELYKKRILEFTEKENALVAEFFKDAREDIGYSSFLEEAACERLEEKVRQGFDDWADFSRAYNDLRELSQLIRDVLELNKKL